MRYVAGAMRAHGKKRFTGACSGGGTGSRIVLDGEKKWTGRALMYASI